MSNCNYVVDESQQGRNRNAHCHLTALHCTHSVCRGHGWLEKRRRLGQLAPQSNSGNNLCSRSQTVALHHLDTSEDTVAHQHMPDSHPDEQNTKHSPV